MLVDGDSALQLGVFAAPRSEGIWDEVRAEIRQSLVADGARPRRSTAEYGAELRARVRTPEGPTDIRFVGIDGPRWMVRGGVPGRRRHRPGRRRAAGRCLHGLVVDRGKEAIAGARAAAAAAAQEVAEQQADGRRTPRSRRTAAGRWTSHGRRKAPRTGR